MLFEDFHDFDGNLGDLLAQISAWIAEHSPRNPVICVIAQTRGYILIRLFYED